MLNSLAKSVLKSEVKENQDFWSPLVVVVALVPVSEGGHTVGVSVTKVWDVSVSRQVH
jgi:hypothetical protein